MPLIPFLLFENGNFSVFVMGTLMPASSPSSSLTFFTGSRIPCAVWDRRVDCLEVELGIEPDMQCGGFARHGTLQLHQVTNLPDCWACIGTFSSFTCSTSLGFTLLNASLSSFLPCPPSLPACACSSPSHGPHKLLPSFLFLILASHSHCLFRPLLEIMYSVHRAFPFLPSTLNLVHSHMVNRTIACAGLPFCWM